MSMHQVLRDSMKYYIEMRHLLLPMRMLYKEAAIKKIINDASGEN